MRAIGFLAFVAVLGATPSFAEDGPTASFVWENDIFGGTDANYTNGVLFSVTSPESADLPVTRLFKRWAPDRFHPDDKAWRSSLTLGHSMFTPRDITASDPSSNDRPYAGWAYVSVGLTAETQRRILDSVELQLGWVGDGAQGETIQRDFHQLIDGEDPAGWRFQIKDEPGVVLRAERKLRSETADWGPLQADADATFGAALGNIDTSVAVGGTVRIGQNISGDYGPPRVRPALGGASFIGGDHRWAWYLFAGAEGRAVARDIFLDGNSFRDSRSVDRETFITDYQGGLAIVLGDARVAFTYVHRAEQFDGQGGVSKFGAGSISWRF